MLFIRWREDCTAEDKQNMRIDNFRKLMNSEGCGELINRERVSRRIHGWARTHHCRYLEKSPK
jgi:hypothetical protein